MEIVLFFVIGTLLGSFLNVLIDRLSTGRKFVTNRSYCENCKKTLKPVDLIPLVSFILLRGRCRYCKAKIPFRLFWVELVFGIITSLLYAGFLNGFWGEFETIFFGIILFCFLGIFVADIVYGIIPDLFVVILSLSGLLFISLGNLPLLNHLMSAIASFAFFLILFIITKGRGMGFGDVKLSFALGLILGSPKVVVALYLAFLTGAAVSIILVLWKKLKFSGGTVPFGPFMVLGGFVAIFYGEQILSFFLERFF